MRPSFCPRLVNGPFDDPGLYIPFAYKNRAIMFDLGDISALTSKEILKISHVFVTHTHMDHFIGFDRLLRLMIGRNKTVYLYGPEGFLKNVEGKLAAYTWNLVQNYTDSLVLEIAEIHPDKVIRRRFSCMHRFESMGKPVTSAFDGRLLDEDDLTVDAAVLDHGVPCLGFAIEERFHINIRSDGLSALGLRPGPWLQDFKKSVYDNLNPELPIRAESTSRGVFLTLPLSELMARIALITPGQKVSYVVDAVYHEGNVEKILSLAHRSDHLFIEAAFLERDRDTARLKNHLTARQAGTLAGWAQVNQITPFHFSPRYQENRRSLETEARQAYAECFGTTDKHGGSPQRGCGTTNGKSG